MEINSAENKKFKTWMAYHQPKYRHRDQCFLVSGAHLLKEAFDAKRLLYQLVSIGTEPVVDDVETYYLAPSLMRRLNNRVSGDDVMGVVKMDNSDFKEAKRVVLLDGVQDPGNVGTIIRTACSFNYDAIIISNETCDVYNDKCVSASQGALFHIKVVRQDLSEAIALLHKQHFSVYATTLDTDCYLENVINQEPMALVFGNEGKGVSESIQRLCDTKIKIRMDGFESLNVAVAAGICLYHFRGGTSNDY